MKIAQVAPLMESVPPKLYGGTERIVSYLTEELVRQRHQVTLFASGDSKTSARLCAICPRSLRLEGRRVMDRLAPHLRMVEMVAQAAGEFDIVHFHTDYLHFPTTRRQQIPAVTTLHGRLDIPELAPLFRDFPDMNLISISDAQRAPLAWSHWLTTVHHGMPDDLLALQEVSGKYLAFLGRISPEKRVDRAIEIAKCVDVPLKIAAKVDPADEDYFESEIRHLLDHPLIEYIGEINDDRKQEFLGNALATLFPIDWPEPFGLVMIESMACGTPVIAFRAGSVPEIIDDGVTGYVVSTVEEAVDAVRRTDKLNRRSCRRVFEERFSVRRMARDYLEAYRRVCHQPATNGDSPRTHPVALEPQIRHAG